MRETKKINNSTESPSLVFIIGFFCILIIKLGIEWQSVCTGALMIELPQVEANGVEYLWEGGGEEP